MKEIENFYRDLYTSNGEIEDDRFANFIQNLDIPKLQDLEKEAELEREITLEECKEVLKTFFSGKSPDEDGFTWKFYNCFFDLLSEDLVISCCNAVYNIRREKCQYPSAEALSLLYRKRTQIYYI